jgi:hypothetical protein
MPHLIFLGFIAIIILDEEHNLGNHSARSFLHLPVISSSVLALNYKYSPQHFVFLLGQKTNVHTHIKQEVKLQFRIF